MNADGLPRYMEHDGSDLFGAFGLPEVLP